MVAVIESQVVDAGSCTKILLYTVNDVAVACLRLVERLSFRLSCGSEAFSSFYAALHLVLVASFLVALAGALDTARRLPTSRFG